MYMYIICVCDIVMITVHFAVCISAQVVCRMLGFEGAIRAFSEAVFGEGKGNIVLDDVQCVGTESELANCIHSDFNVHNCQHREDAGVSCTSKWLSYSIIIVCHSYC